MSEINKFEEEPESEDTSKEDLEKELNLDEGDSASPEEQEQEIDFGPKQEEEPEKEFDYEKAKNEIKDRWGKRMEKLSELEQEIEEETGIADMARFQIATGEKIVAARKENKEAELSNFEKIAMALSKKRDEIHKERQDAERELEELKEKLEKLAKEQKINKLVDKIGEI
ncbi:MAG: hypothetical protein HYT36_00720 [Candidatus Staskawiczbacteria bacterium]|nr:hypothetical protein [Candidatus Staskawiczbacteria bacterium]